jgi:uncharacterized protein YndB with AHSA1/START domain
MTAADLEQTGTDRIEKRITLRATRSRVWRALANAEEFGTWFGMKLEGAFAEGAMVRGQITHPGYEHVTLELFVERIQPEHFFSYRWHPDAVKPGVDYAAEPTTLVEFRLAEADGSTTLTVVESGFDRLPASRRAQAFRGNDSGWTHQMKRIEQHVANG